MNVKSLLPALLLACVIMSIAAAGNLKTVNLRKDNLVLALLRGPYLQSATSTSIIIRWRTDQPSNSSVKIGQAANVLDISVDSDIVTTEHIVKISGLLPKTKYFYSIGSYTEVLQGDAENYFETAPLPGSKNKFRIGIFGDCGNNTTNQVNVRNQMKAYLGSNYMNAWLLLGDNAYNTGTDAEFQSNFFNIYKTNFLKQNPLFPCPGNHDYANSSARQDDHAIPYYDIFSPPSQGEAGGVASGTNGYYSFDYGNIHFLSLDSYGREDNDSRLYDTLGKQVQWIKQDLAANANKDWVVAYWHHPPFTKGSHDSDTETELAKIRQDFIRILERNGVDLVLCGHSHDYERSRLMKGHYGLESSFTSDHQLTTSSGKYDGSGDSCPYFKKSADNEGTIYIVAGSAGQLGGTKAGYPHNALPFADATHGGALMMEVEANRLDMKWITADGSVLDQFTMEKDVNQKQAMAIELGQSITLNATYIGDHQWTGGASTRSMSVSPTFDTQYIVKDALACVSDTFNIHISNVMPVRLVSFESKVNNANEVTLAWQTTEEENASYFAVERSVDGITFAEIGRVNAAGNSNAKLDYSWNDKNPADVKVIYYRLREVDHDGRSQMSRIIAVQLHGSAGPDIVIVPNPSSGSEAQVMLIGAETLKGELILSNLSGHVLKNYPVTLTDKPEMLDTSKLQPGVYFIKIKTTEMDIVKKLVVQ
jgi:hypothetical protein